MKFKHKYLSPVIIYLIVYMFGFLLFGACLVAVNWIYTYLNHLLPELFPVYSVIYDEAAYEKLQRIQAVIGIFAVLFLINFITLKLDNKKYERIISLTDGQYRVFDGIKLYYKEFLISDVVSAILLPTVIAASTYFVPEKVLGYFGLIIPCWLGYNMKLLFGPVSAILTVAIFSFIGRMLVIPLTVRSYRAAWLSDI